MAVEFDDAVCAVSERDARRRQIFAGALGPEARGLARLYNFFLAAGVRLLGTSLRVGLGLWAVWSQ